MSLLAFDSAPAGNLLATSNLKKSRLYPFDCPIPTKVSNSTPTWEFSRSTGSGGWLRNWLGNDVLS